MLKLLGNTSKYAFMQSSFRPTTFVMGTPKMQAFSTEESDSDFQSKAKAPLSNEQLNLQIKKWIDENDVVIFMKGTKKMPQCGFSRFVCILLHNEYGLKNFKDVNVLADEQLRQTIKEYSNWPTIPQIYIKQQFIGGCDIMKEMHQDGSLRELLIRERLINPE